VLADFVCHVCMSWACSSVCACVAIWRVIRSWLTEQQRSRTMLVNRAELGQYVDTDQLEVHMQDPAAQAAVATQPSTSVTG